MAAMTTFMYFLSARRQGIKAGRDLHIMVRSRLQFGDEVEMKCDGSNQPKREKKIEWLGLGQAADEHIDEESDEGRALRCSRQSADAPVEAAIDAGEQHNTAYAVGEELLEEFVLSVAGFKQLTAERGSHLPHGVEPIAEPGLFH